MVKEAPIKQLLVETDTPYLAPLSKRGKQNEPSYLPETVQTVANVKGLALDEVAKVTRENAHTFFGIA